MLKKYISALVLETIYIKKDEVTAERTVGDLFFYNKKKTANVTKEKGA